MEGHAHGRLRVGLHQRRVADIAGSANSFLMILLGSTPMACATFTYSATSRERGPFDLGDKWLLTTQPLGQLPLRQPLLLSCRFQEFGALLV